MHGRKGLYYFQVMDKAINTAQEIVNIYLEKKLIEKLIDKNDHHVNFDNDWSEGERTLGTEFKNNRKLKFFIKVRSCSDMHSIKARVAVVWRRDKVLTHQ